MYLFNCTTLWLAFCCFKGFRNKNSIVQLWALSLFCPSSTCLTWFLASWICLFFFVFFYFCSYKSCLFTSFTTSLTVKELRLKSTKRDFWCNRTKFESWCVWSRDPAFFILCASHLRMKSLDHGVAHYTYFLPFFSAASLNQSLWVLIRSWHQLSSWKTYLKLLLVKWHCHLRHVTSVLQTGLKAKVALQPNISEKKGNILHDGHIVCPIRKLLIKMWQFS